MTYEEAKARIQFIREEQKAAEAVKKKVFADLKAKKLDEEKLFAEDPEKYKKKYGNKKGGEIDWKDEYKENLKKRFKMTQNPTSNHNRISPKNHFLANCNILCLV